MNGSNERSGHATTAVLDARTRLVVAGFSVAFGLAALWVVSLGGVIGVVVSLVLASWAIGGLIVAGRGVVTERAGG